MDFFPTSLICFLVLDTLWSLLTLTFIPLLLSFKNLFRSGSMIRSHYVHHYKLLQYFLLLPILTGNTVTASLSTACCLSSVAALAFERSTSSAEKLSTTYHQFSKWFHIFFSNHKFAFSYLTMAVFLQSNLKWNGLLGLTDEVLIWNCKKIATVDLSEVIKTSQTFDDHFFTSQLQVLVWNKCSLKNLF